MDYESEYEKLLELSKKINVLNSVSHLLEWDQETYMPKEAFLFRASQIELLSSMIHKEKTSPAFKKTLNNLIDLKSGKIHAKKFSPLLQRALYLWRRDYLRANALPNSFVKKFAKLTSEASTIWAHAKKENSFALFAPHLEKIVEMTQERIGYLGYEDHPYDALLEEFDPDKKTKDVELLFSEIAKFIPSLLKKIHSAPQVDDRFLSGNFDLDKQLALGKELLATIGFDFKKGRLDLSNHPFSMTLHSTDSRITTRMRPEIFMDSLSAVLHEAGHSFYEMGFDPEQYGSSLSEPVSLSIHESQSRLWETCIGQSEPFWKYFFPLLKKTFKHNFEKVSFPAFYRAINKVSASPIRVEADEVTYPLHIILRFEIEKALITSSLKVKDIPEAWNSKTEELLGFTPKSDSEGCLQDIHWSMGAFGYFPTYALGNLFAASFFKAYTKKHKTWDTEVEKGNFTNLKKWLLENIHRPGRAFTSDELLKRLGSPKLSTEPYFTYLKDKYQKIYNF